MSQTQWIPTEIDEGAPSAARAYDYLLGGSSHFPADRQLADRVLRTLPARDMSRANRKYLARVVRFLIGEGITQFLDLGSGLPNMDNVHEVAHRIDPTCRVVYVDNEDAAVAHGEMMLDGVEHTTIVAADIRDPDAVLTTVGGLIDLSKPVGLLMLGVTQFLADEDEPWAIAEGFRTAIAPGSFLALSSFTWDSDPRTMQNTIDGFRSHGESPIVPRTRAEIIRLFGDFELVDPGLVFVSQWRPDPDDAPSGQRNMYAGVARKPDRG
ncbi:SAM-dependent methyltransferase [Nocardia sp. CNY236]|uniref:SAM-dependent methyltransferase n=1 Tax=Nocardia sp. CNY236 TaxID=1169152 RepID=UPI000428F117|nr:SAM-dependent methyltransferase [Nocardia sp. CNY236]